MSLNTTESEHETKTLEAIKAERAAAMAVDCGHDGCDGFSHDALDDPSNWMHSTPDETFDTSTWMMFMHSDKSMGFYACDEGAGELNAAEIRALADKYEAFPEWLRSLAGRLDSLQGAW
ncbi:hypothetical protein [Cryobacterium sp. CG_9.6]|uniref:hypothetical protein n=1 Tax=Cryobacterium sp. CG_9.6 TaxID=2760710 RepID=UPI002476BD54|nr:hypothetical protein [Cryobacterium sp. CG_9.6]MDH6237043.1 hypothetical protein [Cryobacterium sp. CG_9.6]